MKKVFGFVLMAVVSICFVTVVCAKSTTATLTTSNSVRVTSDNGLGSTYYTEIYAPSITNQPVVRTSVQRQLLGIWGIAASADANFKTPGNIVFEWGGLGTLLTRATWTTSTSGAKVNSGTFSLWD